VLIKKVIKENPSKFNATAYLEQASPYKRSCASREYSSHLSGRVTQGTPKALHTAGDLFWSLFKTKQEK
jgi:hypothetical protein